MIKSFDQEQICAVFIGLYLSCIAFFSPTTIQTETVLGIFFLITLMNFKNPECHEEIHEVLSQRGYIFQ